MGSPRIVTGNDQRPPAAVTTSRRHRPAADANPTGRRLAILSVTALGVVYGDIGTSPLYAFRACCRSRSWCCSFCSSASATGRDGWAACSVRSCSAGSP